LKGVFPPSRFRAKVRETGGRTMRSLIIAAVAALAFAGAANAATAQGPYKLDAKGKCHAAGGQFVPTNMCQGSFHPVCKTGVACGNTCIAKGKVCHQP
jgi:hypothetical protein